MESIEADYETLRGVLPKAEYQELDNEVLGQLLRTLNPEELKRVSGDIFGRIYEYFLTQFADQKAHDGGEFFTPVSLVSLIANVLEPDRGVILDPASGSGGMFVQSAQFVERLHANPAERLTFYGLEKNPTTSRAGFVMSSQASSAGRDESKVRCKLIETGAVDIMIAIRPNFFYTRTVPCELWFLNRAKPEDRRDKVLMLDARNIYRKVTRKIYDFSPEQLQNLLAIVWIYRGQGDRFFELVARYLEKTLAEARACFSQKDEDGQEVDLLTGYVTVIGTLKKAMQTFIDTLAIDAAHAEALRQLENGIQTFSQDVNTFRKEMETIAAKWEKQERTNAAINEATVGLAPLAKSSRELVKQADMLYKLAGRLIDVCENELEAKESELWVNREVTKARKAADTARQAVVDQFKQVRYFHKQAVWLTERFPDGELRDVKGLVKLVDKAELEANDWSLTPGRYVGVAPEEEDEDFDFEEALRDIHIELKGLTPRQR